MSLQDYNEKLFQAIQEAKPATVRKLLEAKLCSPNCRMSDEYCTPAIILAVKYKKVQSKEDSTKKIQCVNVLLQNRARVNEIDKLGMTASMYAASMGMLELLKILADSAADLHLVNHDGASAVILAAQSGKLECLQFLINKLHISDLNRTDKSGKTALIHAALHGQYECLRRLVDVKVSLNEVDDKGYSALMYATKRDEIKCAYILLNQEETEVNVVSKDGDDTALTLAFQIVPRDYTFLEDLLKRGADLMSKSAQNYLHEMIARDRKKIVRLMIINGCPPLDRICKEDCFQFSCVTKPISPLAVAFLSGFLDTARYLICARFFTAYDVSELCTDPEILRMTGERNIGNAVHDLLNQLDIILKPLRDLQRRKEDAGVADCAEKQNTKLAHRMCLLQWHDLPITGTIIAEACRCRNCLDTRGYKVKM